MYAVCKLLTDLDVDCHEAQQQNLTEEQHSEAEQMVMKSQQTRHHNKESSFHVNLRISGNFCLIASITDPKFSLTGVGGLAYVCWKPSISLL